MISIDLEEEAKKVAGIAKLRKQQVCQADNGITDMPSFVVFQKGDVFDCHEPNHDGHPFEVLPEVLSKAFEEDDITSFDTVSLVIDSYVRVAKPDEVNKYEHGSLAQEFKSQPKTDVKEALTVTTYGYHGGSVGVCMSYVYNDKGVPEFTVITDNEATKTRSEFVDYVMTKFIEFCKRSEV